MITIADGKLTQVDVYDASNENVYTQELSIAGCGGLDKFCILAKTLDNGETIETGTIDIAVIKA